MIEKKLKELRAVLSDMPYRVIACSGGIDSMLLATVAHREAPETTWIVHVVSPAVPGEATERVKNWSLQEDWQLSVVTAGEFSDENYLRNPVDRCYYCKSNLYDRIHRLEAVAGESEEEVVVLSGANLDDLGEYRPGLSAASENGVRHPYIEASFSKESIRRLARTLSLPFAELPASPCLSSRIYTGTRVTAGRLGAIEAGERFLREITNLPVVRCRIREQEVMVEVPGPDREKITAEVLHQLSSIMQAVEPGLSSAQLDSRPYEPGRAFLKDAANLSP